MFFDKEADASIRSIWRDLYDSKIPSYMHKSSSIPHISLTVFNQLDIDDCIKRLSKFAETTHSIEVSLSSIGSFPTDEGALFIAPVVTDHLLKLHNKFHTEFEDLRKDQWEYYLPGNWVPHTTLALIKDKSVLSAAFQRIKENYQVIQARIESVGIVEYTPVKVISRFEFIISN